jgi:hypothetical protein
MNTTLQSFLAVHDEYLLLLEQVYATGRTEPLLPLLASSYHGYFGTRREDRAAFFDLQDALAGIAGTANASPGVQARCLHRHVRMTAEDEAVVFYEKAMDFGTTVASAFVLEVWRRRQGRWQLLRESVEAA